MDKEKKGYVSVDQLSRMPGIPSELLQGAKDAKDNRLTYKAFCSVLQSIQHNPRVSVTLELPEQISPIGSRRDSFFDQPISTFSGH